MGNIWKLISGVLIIISLTMLFVISCSKNEVTTPKLEVKTYTPLEYSVGDNYTLFIANEGEPKLSFEYPSYYRFMGAQYYPTFPGTFIYLDEFPAIVWQVSQSPEHPGVNMTQEIFTGDTRTKNIHIYSHPDSRSAESEINISISQYESSSSLKEVILKEKNRVIFNGREGWESVVTCVSPNNPADVPPRGTRYLVFRELFFDYKGIMLHLFFQSDIAMDEEAKADYEHVVRTFKILDNR